MHLRAVDLKEFYDTMQGRVVQRILREHLRHFWPDVSSRRVLGLGYAGPHLKTFLHDAARVIALMPYRQGAVHWPPEEENLACLCNEEHLPIENNSVDRMLLIHAFHGGDSDTRILHECWRVLSGQGELLLVVPNRSGIWARMDNTPFGHGTPYSMSQVRRMLKDHMFVPEHDERGLFVPPSSSRLILASAPVWEKVGQRFFNAFGGVNIVQATKQLYASVPRGTAPATARIKPVLVNPKSVGVN